MVYQADSAQIERLDGYRSARMEDNSQRLASVWLIVFIFSLTQVAYRIISGSPTTPPEIRDTYITVFGVLAAGSLLYKLFHLAAHRLLRVPVMAVWNYLYSMLAVFLLSYVSVLDSWTIFELGAGIIGIMGFSTVYRCSRRVIVISLLLQALQFMLAYSISYRRFMPVSGLITLAAIVVLAYYLSRSRERHQAQLYGLTRKLEQSKKQFMEASFRDPQTGLYNRRYLKEYFQQQSAAFNRFAEPFSLILLDIDHFKRINDNLGLQVGDEVLKQIAEIIQAASREVDLHARYGGQEFVIVLPGTNLAAAGTVAERIRSGIERHRFESVPWTVSASLGVAEFLQGESLDDLLRRSDDLLYHAKEAGRNQVVSEADEDTGRVT
jgi:diguanylate cyclase (GGDEF)-like protein